MAEFARVTPLVRARLASDLNTPVAEQAVLAEFISGGHFARHIRRTREMYRERQKDLVELVPEIMGNMLEVRSAPAGMRLLGLLPLGVDSRAVGWAAAERGAAQCCTASRARLATRPRPVSRRR